MLGVFPDASREVDLADMMPLLWKGKEERDAAGHIARQR